MCLLPIIAAYLAIGALHFFSLLLTSALHVNMLGAACFACEAAHDAPVHARHPHEPSMLGKIPPVMVTQNPSWKDTQWAFA